MRRKLSSLQLAGYTMSEASFTFTSDDIIINSELEVPLKRVLTDGSFAYKTNRTIVQHLLLVCFKRLKKTF